LKKILFIIIIFLRVDFAFAQEYSDNATYYYNNLETATAGNTASFGATGLGNATRTSTNVTIDASTSSPLSGSTSLRSISLNAISAIRWDFVGNGTTTVDLTANDFEWNFLYKNNSTTGPTDPDIINAGTNEWRYWLFANTYTTNNMQGFYISHYGTTLELRYRYDATAGATRFNSILTATMANDQKAYIIKVQRLKDGRWTIYKDEYVPGMTTAKTQVATSTSTTGSNFNTYKYSYLESTCTNTGRFQWDNLDMYSRYFELTSAGANTAANGITQSPYYPGQTVTLFGLKIISRGNYTINQLVASMATTNGAAFEGYLNGTGSLYRSDDDDFYSTSLDTYINSVSFTGSVVQDYSVNNVIASSGNTDGTYSVPGYYFVTGTIKSTLNYGSPPTGTFTLNGISTLTGNNNSSAFTYTATGVTTSTSTTISFTNVAPPTVTGAATLCGTGSTTVTASGVTGATYNWYTAATGGVLLQSSTSGTYKPFVANTTTYYVSATTPAGTSARIGVKITITPKISASITAPVLSWPFNNSLTDASGNGNTGLPQNSPSLVADRFGNANSAYSFNGTNNFITSTTQFAPTQLIFSISVWFKTTNAGGMLVGFGGNQTVALNATHDRHIYMASTGQLYFGVYNAGFTTVNTPSGTSYADGLWHHAVATCGPTNGLQLYVDGVLRSSPKAYVVPENTGGYWRIGNDNVNGWPGANGTYFNGVLDDFAVYNHELTATEAADNELNLYTFSTLYCANNTYTITAPAIAGATYAWVDNSNPANTSNTNPATFATATTSSYTLTVTSGTCSSVSTVTPITPTFTWTGNANSKLDYDDNNWFNTSTGVANSKPGLTSGTESIIIPAGLSVYPELYGNRSIYSLTIAPGATLTLNNNTLNVGCNIIDNSTTTNGILTGTTGGNSLLNWAGTVANQAYYGSNAATTPAQLYSMTVNNTNASGKVTIASGKIDIWNLLTLTKGILAVTSPAELTLKSSSSLNYAQIATIPSGSSIQGNIIDEVLFQGGAGFRNYRSMGAPVYNDVAYNTANGSYILASLKSSFIITGNGGTSNGFDASSNNGATIRTYNTATKNYTFVSNLNTAANIPAGTGFYMYYRGNNTIKPGTPTAADPYGSKTNRSLSATNTYAIPESVTFKYKGIPNQGNVSTASIPSGNITNFYFIANPYAATLDFDAVRNSTSYTYTPGSGSPSTLYWINTKTWVWSPSAGNYAVYDATNPNLAINLGKRYIVPGQGFFVQANNQFTGSSQTLVLTEAMKSTSNSSKATRFLSTSVPADGAGIEPPILRLKVARDNTISDEIGFAIIKDSKDSIDATDATHMNGDYMNFTTITPDNQYLSIDKRPGTSTKTVVPLFINVATDTIYTFKHTYLSKIMRNYKITLVDSLLNNNVDIANIDYAVNIYRAKPETYGGNRFKLIIEQLPAPVTYYAFAGQLTPAKKGLLSWKTSEHRFGTTYQVQRSQDNKTFADIGALQVGSTDSLRTDFNMTDDEIQKGTNYYRLVQTDVFGNKLLSNTVQLDYNLDAIPSSNGFKLYPNPVTDNFNVISDKTYTGKITLRVYDSSSNLKLTKTVTQLSAYEPIQQYVSNFRLGVYIVEIRDDKDKVLTTLKFVKQ